MARRFDASRWENSGKSKGCGIGKFSLKAAGLILKLSPVTVRTLLRDAKLSGLIRHYNQSGDWVTVYYSSLERAIAIAGLDKVGSITSINIDSLSNLHLVATEVECQNLQRSSFHLQRREEIEQIKPGEPVDRVDLKSDSYTFKEQTLNVTGTMQPDIARRIFNVASDPDGMLSRFLPAIAGIPDNFAQWSNVRVSLNRILTGLIQKLERLPETLLTLPPRTADVFSDYWQKLRRGQQINFGDNPAYSFFLGKQISYVGRFAIVLHCLENLGAPEIPSRVTPETMHKAVRLSLFYCNQFLLLQSKSAQQQPIEGILLDILKFAKEKGGQLSTRDLCRSRFKNAEVDGKKITGSTAGKLLKGIADAGFGFFEVVGNSRILTVLSPTVTDCHRLSPALKLMTVKV